MTSNLVTNNANNNVAPQAHLPPAAQSARQAASQRTQALRTTTNKINELAEKHTTPDRNASILIGIKELLGFYEPPNAFPEKLERLLARLVNGHRHLGVNFSTMDETQTATILAKLQATDLRNLALLHLAFDFEAQGNAGTKMDGNSLAQALNAINKRNPNLAITLDLENQTLSEEDCTALGNALPNRGITHDMRSEAPPHKLIMRNVLPQTPQGMSAFMRHLKDSSVTHLKWSDIQWPSSPLQTYHVQDQFRHGLRETQLCVLNVSGVDINCYRAAHLVQSCPASLEKLELMDNKLADFRANLFFRAVSKTDVKELNVSRNFIGDAGALAFAHLLHENAKRDSRLVKVNLADNLIEDKGAQHIAAVLRTPGCISQLKVTEIDLRRNLFGPASAAALDEAAQAYKGRLTIRHSHMPEASGVS